MAQKYPTKGSSLFRHVVTRGQINFQAVNEIQFPLLTMTDNVGLIMFPYLCNILTAALVIQGTYVTTETMCLIDAWHACSDDKQV